MAEMPVEARIFKPDNRERVRRAIASVVEAAAREAGTGKDAIISVARVKAAGAKDQNAATKLLSLWRSGVLSVADSWADERPAPSSAKAETGPDLGARVRAAQTDGDREALLHELAALVADGQKDPAEAREIRGALAEARQQAEKKREQEPPPEDPRKLLLASPEAMMVARVMDRLVSDERFDAICAFAARQMEEDLTESPNEDEGGA